MKRAALFTELPDEKRNGLANPVTEIALILFCVLVAEWAILPLFGKGSMMGAIPVGSAFVIMILSHWFRRESPRELGWRFDNFWRCIALMLPVMFLATAVLILIGWLCGSLRITGGARPGWNTPVVFVGLFAWGLVQQYALQGFLNRRAQEIWGKGSASVLFAASLFAFFHMPNFWLAIATFFGGLLWAWAYQRSPNLIALGLSHAVMSVILVLTVPYSSLHGMRVGYGYFQ